MTLNEFERRNSPYFAFFTEFDYFAGQYVAVVENRPLMPVNIVPVFYFLVCHN